MKKLLLLLMIFAISCTSVYHDKTPAPINNNQMRLEMSSCGHQEVGLLGCFYGNKEEHLEIPLWRAGEYQIKSEVCNYYENKTYRGTQKLKISYQKLLENKAEDQTTCLYNVKVFINGFDNGFEGFFLLTKGDIKPVNFKIRNSKYIGYAGIQIVEDSQAPLSFDFIADYPGRIVWRGCNQDGEKDFEKDPKIELEEVIGTVIMPKFSCVLTVGIIPEDENLEVELGKLHVNIFSKTVRLLPQPVIYYKNNKLTVYGDNQLAAMAIDDFYLVKKTRHKKRIYKKNVMPEDKVNVRVMTSNGRFILMKVQNGEILWVK